MFFERAYPNPACPPLGLSARPPQSVAATRPIKFPEPSTGPGYSLQQPLELSLFVRARHGPEVLLALDGGEEVLPGFGLRGVVERQRV